MHLPSLPPELWIRILSQHTDLSHLWTTCRRVSRDFLAYAEQVFAEYHLRRNVEVRFYLERHNLGGRGRGRGRGRGKERGSGWGMEVETGYLRFREDGGEVCSCGKAHAGDNGGDGGGESGEGGMAQVKRRLVYFSSKQREDGAIIDVDWIPRHKKNAKGGSKNKKPTSAEMLQRWESNIANIRPEMPNYTIRIGHLVNDTALPGLTFCGEERAVAFDWRGMFARFFREVERGRMMERKYTESLVSEENGHNSLHPAPTPTPPTTKPTPSNPHRPAFAKLIRRARLREAYSHPNSHANSHFHSNVLARDDEKIWAIDSMTFYEQSRGTDGRVMRPLSEIPGAGLGEKWFGSVSVLQEMVLDEWSCLDRIERMVEEGREEDEG
ncbi:hypothetical protein K491DRAFT_690353 [Lophiostoma macrostomum CBS 122681]|uniref:F-box domain-containing protein n=1 Tax=Lophiostoma macrostomum CBS 122681 TaxID=1314788 RepID=A0A6A6TH06_9PLEO|nr:hypothetical protein K491DRAFT_690353 [Lophiostoma macrostomum CBS 122681]